MTGTSVALVPQQLLVLARREEELWRHRQTQQENASKLGVRTHKVWVLARGSSGGLVSILAWVHAWGEVGFLQLWFSLNILSHFSLYKLLQANRRQADAENRLRTVWGLPVWQAPLSRARSASIPEVIIPYTVPGTHIRQGAKIVSEVHGQLSERSERVTSFPCM